MRSPVRIFFAFAWLAAGNFGSALAQSGTLQVPGNPRPEQPVKPPAAAPRTPVQKAGSAIEHKGVSAEHKTPVVAPRQPSHPHKPEQAAGPAAKPAPTPAPPVAEAPAEKPVTTPEKQADPEKPEGAKLPRFVSLRSDDVNMRAGPGTRYRIEWVYKRRDLPVEIEREFDVWRWVRDPDGIQGWVHQATLMGRRSFIVQHGDATLRATPNESGGAVAILKTGVIGRIRSCEASSAWCNVQAGGYRGYLRRDQFWGVLPGEAINP